MRSRDLLIVGLYVALGSALMTWGGCAIARSLAPDQAAVDRNSIWLIEFAAGIIFISQAPSLLMLSRIRGLERRVAELTCAGGVA